MSTVILCWALDFDNLVTIWRMLQEISSGSDNLSYRWLKVLDFLELFFLANGSASRFILHSRIVARQLINFQKMELSWYLHD